MDDDVVASIRDLYRYFEMMTRDHFELDDDYDDDMIWWDYLYVYAMTTYVCAWHARDYCIKPVQIQKKYVEKKSETNKTSSSEGNEVSSSVHLVVALLMVKRYRYYQ